MAIKRAPITEMYQVNIYCDKCGREMKYSGCGQVLDSYPPMYMYTYVCECGHTETSSQSYPHQMAIADFSKLETIG